MSSFTRILLTFSTYLILLFFYFYFLQAAVPTVLASINIKEASLSGLLRYLFLVL